MDITSLKVGDCVWRACIGETKRELPCLMCNGNKFVTVILGNGDKRKVGCPACIKWDYENSCDKRTGTYTKVTEVAPKAVLARIEEIHIHHEVDVSSCSLFDEEGHDLDPFGIFQTEKEALKHAKDTLLPKAAEFMESRDKFNFDQNMEKLLEIAHKELTNG